MTTLERWWVVITSPTLIVQKCAKSECRRWPNVGPTKLTLLSQRWKPTLALGISANRAYVAPTLHYVVIKSINSIEKCTVHIVLNSKLLNSWEAFQRIHGQLRFGNHVEYMVKYGSETLSNLQCPWPYTPISRGIISTTERDGIKEISCKHPLEIGGTTWIHHDLEIYSTLRSM